MQVWRYENVILIGMLGWKYTVRWYAVCERGEDQRSCLLWPLAFHFSDCCFQGFCAKMTSCKKNQIPFRDGMAMQDVINTIDSTGVSYTVK